VSVEPETVGLPTDWESVFRRTLRDVMARGHEMCAGPGLSIGSGQPARELLNYSIELRQPRDRLLVDPRCRVNLLKTAGRFAWMMSGNDRLADIEWYDAGARRFSDDGWTVPGSSDGARLRNPRPGLDQLTRVIQLLRSEPDTRRAVAVIYQPDDAGRLSRDVPCTIALAYNLRHGRLHATTIMRSSNAFKVLPYDLFLFSMVAEVVAAELEVELGSYHQFAASLHVYHRDLKLAGELAADPRPSSRAVMPPMPKGGTLDDVAALLRIEQALRGPDLDSRELGRQHERIARELPRYWQGFARLLVLHAVQRRVLEAVARRELEETVIEELDEPFRSLLPPSPARAP
jgi:hypothetical protein